MSGVTSPERNICVEKIFPPSTGCRMACLPVGSRPKTNGPSPQKKVNGFEAHMSLHCCARS